MPYVDTQSCCFREKWLFVMYILVKIKWTWLVLILLFYWYIHRLGLGPGRQNTHFGFDNTVSNNKIYRNFRITFCFKIKIGTYKIVINDRHFKTVIVYKSQLILLHIWSVIQYLIISNVYSLWINLYFFAVIKNNKTGIKLKYVICNLITEYFLLRERNENQLNYWKQRL